MKKKNIYLSLKLRKQFFNDFSLIWNAILWVLDDFLTKKWRTFLKIIYIYFFKYKKNTSERFEFEKSYKFAKFNNFDSFGDFVGIFVLPKKGTIFSPRKCTTFRQFWGFIFFK